MRSVTESIARQLSWISSKSRPASSQLPTGSSQCSQTRWKRVRHERKPSEQFPGACLRITSELPTIQPEFSDRAEA
jgi:hypothetical protein